MSEHAKRIKRELVMKGTILDVYKDTMELPNGKTEEWDFVSHRKGAAAVVAVRETANGETVQECFRAYDVRDSCRSERQCDRRYQSVCCKGTRRGDRIPE